MGMASHLGPWLLGTVKNSVDTVSAANAAAGKNRNMGFTSVTQTFTLNGANGAGTFTGCVIPAGSLIESITVYVSVLFNGTATLTFNLNSDNVTNSPTITALGTPSAGTGADATKVGLWINTGSVDKVFSAVVGGTPTSGTAVVAITYGVRNADGSSNPAYNQA